MGAGGNAPAAGRAVAIARSGVAVIGGLGKPFSGVPMPILPGPGRAGCGDVRRHAAGAVCDHGNVAVAADRVAIRRPPDDLGMRTSIDDLNDIELTPHAPRHGAAGPARRTYRPARRPGAA